MSVYLQRYAYPHQLIDEDPSPDTGIIVVIPCYNEPYLLESLESLKACDLPTGTTEVIIIINESDNSMESIKKTNQDAFHSVQTWSKQHNSDRLKFYVHHLTFPTKHAGVGLARKAGMDEAVRRFEAIQKPGGMICCFDADSTCDSNYLVAISSAFNDNPQRPLGASIYFEHPANISNGKLDIGVQQYELHLRYYVNALRYAGFPFAFQTIGSSMAVRSYAYQKHGGMNKRKAGEDFYFLHKIIPMGQFIEINDTRVIPSPRVSDRVPFGTGRAMGDWINGDKSTLDTYNFTSFKDLRVLFKSISSMYQTSGADIDKIISRLPESLQSFIPKGKWTEHIEEINRQSTSIETFVHRFFLWFNGFKVLKFIHFARDHFHPNESIVDSASQLAATYFELKITQYSAQELLKLFRTQDRNFKSEKIGLKHLYFA